MTLFFVVYSNIFNTSKMPRKYGKNSKTELNGLRLTPHTHNGSNNARTFVCRTFIDLCVSDFNVGIIAKCFTMRINADVHMAISHMCRKRARLQNQSEEKTRKQMLI